MAAGSLVSQTIQLGVTAVSLTSTDEGLSSNGLEFIHFFKNYIFITELTFHRIARNNHRQIFRTRVLQSTVHLLRIARYACMYIHLQSSKRLFCRQEKASGLEQV